MKVRILLADDHTLLRAGVRDLLEREEDITVVGDVSDGLAAVEAVARTSPHVVVMDISMPGMNGLEATRRIRAAAPRVRVLCLSMHSERHFVCSVLRAGASGYVLKDATAEELVRAVRTVASGQKYVSPAVAGVVIDELTRPSPREADDAENALTAREREVLQLLSEGHSTKHIALRLNVSAKTVASHRDHIMQKLDLDSIAGLTKYAIRHGLTTLDQRSPR